MIHYGRRQISRALVDDLERLAISGESIVLLTPVYGSTRRLLDSIRERLQKTGSMPLIQFSVAPRGWQLDVKQRVHIYRNSLVDRIAGDPIAIADAFVKDTGKPVVIIGSGIDRMRESQARKFLKQIRTRVSSRTLVAILSGSKDFRDLVHGPNSEFNCARQFILQGYNKEIFRERLSKHCAALAIEWTDTEKAVDLLYEQTQGDVYLIGMLLAKVVDLRLAKKYEDCSTHAQVPVDPDKIMWEQAIDPEFPPHQNWAHVFQSGVEVLSQDPQSWKDLESAVAGKPIQVGREDLGPSTLEISGFLRLNHHGEYEWANPIFHRFALRYFTKTRFARFYGLAGQWNKAFARYKTSKYAWPAYEEAPEEVQLLLRSLEADMHFAALNNPRRVEWLFRHACRWLLGFSEVEAWHRVRGKWIPKNDGLPEQVQKVHSHLIQSLGDSDEFFGRLGLVIRMNTQGAQQEGVLVITDLARQRVISSRNCELSKRLAKQFQAAHKHAIEKETTQKRLLRREKGSAIVRAVLAAIGSSIPDIRQGLVKAAQMLCDLEYRRVLVSLVDPLELRIQGVVCIPDDSVGRSLIQKTNYSIKDDVDRDVQPWVVHNKVERVVLDPISDGLVNAECRDVAGLEAFAIIPVFGIRNDVVGTIHIERKNGLPPSKEEVADLKEFGRQLGGLLDAGARTTLLLSALNKLSEPILLLNQNQKLLYGNQAARSILPGLIASPGWQVNLRRLHSSKLGKPFAEKALSEDHYVRPLTGVGADPEYRGQALCARLLDFRKIVVGGLIHIEDQRFLHKVYDVLRKMAEAPKGEVVNTILQEAEALNFSKARYYVFDDKDQSMISRAAVGFVNEENRNAFEEGKIVLYMASDDTMRLCLKQGTVALISTKDLPEGTIKTNEYGLQLQVVYTNDDLEARLEKEPGSVWVEVALKMNDRIFGMLSLERSKDSPLQPEEFENLKVFGSLASTILLAIDEQKTLKDAFEKAIAILAHQFRNKMMSLSNVQTSYLQLAQQHPQTGRLLQPLNERFAQERVELDNILDRAREFFGTVVLRVEKIELRQLFEHLQASWSNVAFHIQFTNIIIEGDRHHLATCFSELVENAVQMKFELFVEIIVKAHIDDNSVVIEIEDNGPGVPVEKRKAIFDLDYSLHPGGKRGTGWGLYFIQRIIEKHSGTIDVGDRKDGKSGAAFRITLPHQQTSEEVINASISNSNR
jgi:signal transduction histidine kinase